MFLHGARHMLRGTPCELKESLNATRKIILGFESANRIFQPIRATAVRFVTAPEQPKQVE